MSAISLAEIRKTIVGVAGVLTQLIPVLALHGEAERIASFVLAAATAVGVYLVPNKTRVTPIATPPVS